MKQFRLLLFFVAIAFSSSVMAQTVYTTKTGKKYHKNSCKFLKYSKNKTTIDKAKNFGYTACKVCKPTQQNTKDASGEEPNSIAPGTQSKSTSKKTIAIQCTGKTKAGRRCKRKTKNANGRCYQH